METVTRGTVLVNPEVNKVCDEDKEKLSELYEELGKSYYEGAFEDPLPQLLPIFDSITEILNKYKQKLERCPKCGAELEEDARFCDECGASVEEYENRLDSKPKELKCKNCGNILKPTSKFCGACGTRVEE